MIGLKKIVLTSLMLLLSFFVLYAQEPKKQKDYIHYGRTIPAIHFNLFTALQKPKLKKGFPFLSGPHHPDAIPTPNVDDGS
jgi:hypothetical protein